jgi:glycine/D-amino acid oxidase-like deaminating enzyme
VNKSYIKALFFYLPWEIINIGWVQHLIGTDKSTKTSINGREWLISKLNQFLRLPYTILEQRAEIRATVQDRRPLLGVHPKHKNMFIFNGVGTRGVLMSPLLSQWLFEFIENNKKLPASVNINRFENKYFRN